MARQTESAVAAIAAVLAAHDADTALCAIVEWAMMFSPGSRYYIGRDLRRLGKTLMGITLCE